MDLEALRTELIADITKQLVYGYKLCGLSKEEALERFMFMVINRVSNEPGREAGLFAFETMWELSND